MTCPVCHDSTSRAWLYCWGCKLSKNERTHYAIQHLNGWAMTHSTHPAFTLAVAKADALDESMNPEIERIYR